jgi:uroporphyrinogen-III synthase
MKAVGRLQGKRIAVTRAVERAEGLASALRAEGAQVSICPTIAYAPPEDPAPLEAALRRLDRYDWIVFTSAAAVDALAERGALPPPAHVRVAVVGKATAASIEARGGRVDLIPAEQNAEGVLAALHDVAGKRFLLPLADIGRDTLVAGLRARGAVVDVVTAYRTVPGPGARDLITLLCGCVCSMQLYSAAHRRCAICSMAWNSPASTVRLRGRC